MAKAHFIRSASGRAELPVDFWIIIDIYTVLRRLSLEPKYEKSLERRLDWVQTVAGSIRSGIGL
jgi:hypothetical protein